ncbi:poly-gamma-glutamate hydrolase family protein [Enhygromyxa salina]|nr:poly-gamma-glutamate hydrolase family protein [Enhygromyxa salina]
MVPIPVSIPVSVTSPYQYQGLSNDPWSCSVSGAIANVFGLGSQVRVRRSVDQFAVYTVTDVRYQDPVNRVRMGSVARERVGTPNVFSGTLHTPLATKLMSDTQAKNAGEFVERIADSPNNHGLVVLAPHGGVIEVKTDLQARWVMDELPNADVSCWICSGWTTEGGAHTRWHVASTELHPVSFPGLATIANRGFAYAVAFHGMNDAGVRIGGSAPFELKEMLRQAIKHAVGDYPVAHAADDDPNGGTSPDNVVNWITAGGVGGVHLEQGPLIRSKYWFAVAQAVADVFRGLV